MILPLASKASRFLYALFFVLVTGCILSIVTYYPLVQSTICQCQADLRLPAQTPSSNSHPPTTHKIFFPPNPRQGQELLDQARLTANGGFFMVKDTPSSTAYGYGISMLHQSHCVDMLRAALFGGEHDHTLHFKRDGLRDGDSLDDGHLEHCLDYISQVSVPILFKTFCNMLIHALARALYVLQMIRSNQGSLIGRREWLLLTGRE